MQTRKITFHIDNEGLVGALSTQTSRPKRQMHLIRPFVLLAMQHYIILEQYTCSCPLKVTLNKYYRCHFSLSVDPVPATCPGSSGQVKVNTTGVSLSNITAETGRLLNAYLADNTHKAYSTVFGAFNTSRENFKLQEFWPPTVEQIIQFISYMSFRNFSCRTAELYVTAVNFLCKIRSVSDTTKHFLVTKLLESFRQVGKIKKVKLPITFSLLHSMLTRISASCFKIYESVLFAATLILAFCGFLRVGELDVEKNRGSDCHKVLAIGYEKFSSNYESMHVYYPK